MTRTEWWASFALGVLIHCMSQRRPRLLVHPGNLTVH
jgi:hypothetical protein